MSACPQKATSGHGPGKHERFEVTRSPLIQAFEPDCRFLLTIAAL